AFGAIAPVRAQFLKDLTNNLKQTLQSRANGKSNQAANHLLDKVDSAMKIGGAKGTKTGGTGGTGTAATGGAGSLPGMGKGSFDTSGMGRVLGAFVKTAQENPNDTNQADLLNKSLTRMIGGDGVSSQDSAKAIKSFMTAAGGSGVLYESIILTNSKRGTTRDTTYIYLTNSGEGRSEMRLPIPGVKTPKFIVIGRANEPTYSVILDADTRSYSLNVIDTALINSGIEKYQVTRIGTESVSGYSCIHSRLVSTTGSGMFATSSTMDLWTSTSVPGYPIYSKLLTFQSSNGGLLGALNKAGAGGFLVKMTAGDGKDFTMTNQLMKAEQRNFPSALFEIPAGYGNEAASTSQRLLSGSVPAKQP
ncbi:MAG TPA: DUF4412 domain-containing protein, partial [Puia sp.]|nr:DUF4412 domain-containing protein [Puia sp.]